MGFPYFSCPHYYRHYAQFTAKTYQGALIISYDLKAFLSEVASITNKRAILGRLTGETKIAKVFFVECSYEFRKAGNSFPYQLRFSH